jgi:hypothetical protein
MIRANFVGILLIVGGLLLLIRRIDLPMTERFTTWEFILFLSGVIMLLIAHFRSNRNLMLWSGLLTGMSLHMWGKANLDGWPDHWSFLFIIAGAAFLLVFASQKDRRSGIIGILLILTGFAAWPGLTWVAGSLNNYWPVLLVVLGIFLITKKA